MCSNDRFRRDERVFGTSRSGAPVFARRGLVSSLPALEADLELLSAFYDEAAPLREIDDAEFFRVRAGESDWSPGQHLFHVSLANELALRNVELITAGTNPLVQDRPAPSLLALLILPVGAMPRGVGKSPRTVAPPVRSNPQIAWEAFDGNVEALRRLRGNLDQVRAARGGIRHRELGVLGAAHWIRFAALHGWHHLRIVRQLVAA